MHYKHIITPLLGILSLIKTFSVKKKPELYARLIRYFGNLVFCFFVSLIERFSSR